MARRVLIPLEPEVKEILCDFPAPSYICDKKVCLGKQLVHSDSVKIHTRVKPRQKVLAPVASPLKRQGFFVYG